MNTNYIKPAMRVVSINQRANLLIGSGPQVTSVSGNVFDTAPVAGSGTARGREFGYDEDE